MWTAECFAFKIHWLYWSITHVHWKLPLKAAQFTELCNFTHLCNHCHNKHIVYFCNLQKSPSSPLQWIPSPPASPPAWRWLTGHCKSALPLLEFPLVGSQGTCLFTVFPNVETQWQLRPFHCNSIRAPPTWVLCALKQYRHLHADTCVHVCMCHVYYAHLL